MHNLVDIHWRVVKRILQFFCGTIDQGLLFHRCANLRLLAFCDLDWWFNIDNKKSTIGYCVYLGPNLFWWLTKKQHVASQSTTKAEFQDLAVVLAELTWLQSLVAELHLPCAVLPTVFCGNLVVVLLVANPIFTAPSTLRLNLFFVREKVSVLASHIPP